MTVRPPRNASRPPVPLIGAVECELPKSGYTYRLVAASAERGVLMCQGDAPVPPANRRMGIRARGRRWEGLEIAALVESPTDPPRGQRGEAFLARFLGLRARDPYVLARALRDILGLDVEMARPDPELGTEEVVLYDAASGQVRITNPLASARPTPAPQAVPNRPERPARTRTTQPQAHAAHVDRPRVATPVPTPAPGAVQPADPRMERRLASHSRLKAQLQQVHDRIRRETEERVKAMGGEKKKRPGVTHDLLHGMDLGQGSGSHFGLRAGVADLASVRGGSGEPEGRRVVGREGPRPKPVYKRPTTPSEFRVRGKSTRMVFGWVGETHCLFVLPGTEEVPKIDDKIEVAVPADPIAEGVMWVQGRVSQLTFDDIVGRTKVEVDILGKHGHVPSAYKRLVHFCAK